LITVQVAVLTVPAINIAYTKCFPGIKSTQFSVYSIIVQINYLHALFWSFN